MTATEEDVTLCVLLQATKQCDYKRNPLFLRLAVNGVLQADIVSKRISGLEGECQQLHTYLSQKE